MTYKYYFIILCLLCACTGPNLPTHKYTNTHKLDNVSEQSNFCLQIENTQTIYKKGHKNLPVSPFLGQEGYSASSVTKQIQNYETEYVNNRCDNPIKLQRQIEVTSISYPDTCYGATYAGAVYTGAMTNYYSNMSITTVNSTPIYNTTQYQCTKTVYFVNIDFYKGNSKVGSIASEYWSEYGFIDNTIRHFTNEFLTKMKNDIKANKKNRETTNSCASCYKESSSFLDNVWCSLKGCDNIQ